MSTGAWGRGLGAVEGAADVLLGAELDADTETEVEVETEVDEETGADVEREAGAEVLELEAAVVDDACVLEGEILL